MFSRRFKWDLEPTRFARLIEEKKRAGARVLDLTESNPTRAGIDYPVEEILAALAKTSSMLYEPTPRGLPVKSMNSSPTSGFSSTLPIDRYMPFPS